MPEHGGPLQQHELELNPVTGVGSGRDKNGDAQHDGQNDNDKEQREPGAPARELEHFQLCDAAMAALELVSDRVDARVAAAVDASSTATDRIIHEK